MRTVFSLPVLATVALFSFPLYPAQAAQAAPISLQKPIACTIGKDCFIQQYADHDAGPGEADYMCGTAVYDGHDGTDFRIADKVAQARGVAVVAAADGVVKGFRDGQPDFDVGAFDRDKVKGIECGNGVLIMHADGWETQYCHMRQGSVKVKTGDLVKAGTVLGLVGQSGDAEFPHVHLTVRYQGKAVDPFAFGTTTCDAKQGQSHFLWRQADRAELAYHDTVVITGAFATSALTEADIDRGGIAAPVAESPALVFYGRAINLHKGDTQTLSLTGPDGKVIVDNHIAGVERDKALYMAFTGKKLTVARWPAGTYKGTYSVLRDGKPVATQTFAYVIK